MTTVLALATSSQPNSVALGRIEVVVPSWLQASNVAQLSTQAETIYVDLRELQESQVRSASAAADVGLIAFDAGPGAFTGVRIGCAVAQGLGFAWSVPVLPVCSLYALAAAHFVERRSTSDDVEQLYCVAIDARMNEIYYAAYVVGCSGSSRSSFKVLSEPRVAAAEHVVDAFESLLDSWPSSTMQSEVFLVGDGFSRSGPHSRLADWASNVASASIQRSRIDCSLVESTLDATAIVHAASVLLNEMAAELKLSIPLGSSFELDAMQFAAERAAPIYVRNKVALDKFEQHALRAENMRLRAK